MSVQFGSSSKKEMDVAAVDVQIISLSEPSVELFDPKTGMAEELNQNSEVQSVYFGFEEGTKHS